MQEAFKTILACKDHQAAEIVHVQLILRGFRRYFASVQHHIKQTKNQIV